MSTACPRGRPGRPRPRRRRLLRLGFERRRRGPSTCAVGRRPSSAPSASPAAASARSSTRPARPTSCSGSRRAAGSSHPSFLATQAPIFTLYGDGTIVFRNPMKEGPPPVGDVYRLNAVPHGSSERGPDPGDARAARSARAAWARPAPSTRTTWSRTRRPRSSRVNAGGLEEDGLGLRARDGRSDIGGCRSPGRRSRSWRASLGDFDHGGTIPTSSYVPTALPRHPARRRTGSAERPQVAVARSSGRPTSWPRPTRTASSCRSAS